MPIKGGKLTRSEIAMAQAYAVTGDKAYAAHVAGVSPKSNAVGKALARPAVQAEIARLQTERLFGEILPLAVEAHLNLLKSPATPAGARVQAVKLAYDRTLGVDDGKTDKQPHEMTPEELAKAISEAKLRAAALESAKADQARPVLEHESSTIDDEGDVFA